MTFDIRSLGATLGAEVQGIDLARDPDPRSIAAVRDLWARHQLLLFRDQQLEEADLVRFSRALGELEIHVRREYLSPDNPEILYVSNIVEDGRRIGILSDAEVGWHYDQIYLPRPAMGSLLYAVKLPREGGQTSFADMAAAYDALPEEVKAKLEGRRAVQSYEAFNNRYSTPTNEQQKRRTPDLDHPVVRRHPDTGRKGLYICPGMTTRILGLDASQSDELLSFLFDWCVRPEFVYTHHWRHGDALLWNNISTMHRREPFDSNEQRLMKRTTILAPEDRAVPV